LRGAASILGSGPRPRHPRVVGTSLVSHPGTLDALQPAGSLPAAQRYRSHPGPGARAALTARGPGPARAPPLHPAGHPLPAPPGGRGREGRAHRPRAARGARRPLPAPPRSRRASSSSAPAGSSAWLCGSAEAIGP
jgi:hypothetical protein